MTRLPSREMVDLGDPMIRRLLAVAARKGVTLDIRPLRGPTPTITAEQIASEVGCEVGQIVSSRLCVAPLPRGTLKPIVCLTAGRGEIAHELLAAVAGVVEVRVRHGARGSRHSGLLAWSGADFRPRPERLGRDGQGLVRVPLGLGADGLGLRGHPHFPEDPSDAFQCHRRPGDHGRPGQVDGELQQQRGFPVRGSLGDASLHGIVKVAVIREVPGSSSKSSCSRTFPTMGGSRICRLFRIAAHWSSPQLERAPSRIDARSRHGWHWAISISTRTWREGCDALPNTCCLARALDREMAGPACQKTCDAHEALLGTPAV